MGDTMLTIGEPFAKGRSRLLLGYDTAVVAINIAASQYVPRMIVGCIVLSDGVGQTTLCL